jgi:prepilin-type processing-associated H-X9-DG protein
MFAERYKVCNTTMPLWAAQPWSSPYSLISAFGFKDSNISSLAGDNPNFCDYNSITFQVAPAPDSCLDLVTQGPHTGSMNVGMGDGSVRGVSTSVSMATWMSACLPNDGIPLGNDW